MSDSLATIRHEDNVAILAIDVGKVNVFSPAMAKRLRECFAQIGSDVGAVVVRTAIYFVKRVNSYHETLILFQITANLLQQFAQEGSAFAKIIWQFAIG